MTVKYIWEKKACKNWKNHSWTNTLLLVISFLQEFWGYDDGGKCSVHRSASKFMVGWQCYSYSFAALVTAYNLRWMMVKCFLHHRLWRLKNGDGHVEKKIYDR